MSDAINVQGLSKRYILGHQRDQRDALRHLIEDAARAPFKYLRSWNKERRSNREEFWALKDVSFDVKQGEVIGIIGRNGAGKSTLLKILSRITEPTEGRIVITGRVASLLEVGTGFHQELSGRENIYLNGAILGMGRSEIRKKFDEIVAFAEVERFLDTPVKRYSSGMYVRLAFSVAAHLEPDILIIDEVLAVGDSQFQNKCLGKMEEVAGTGGRTVLFVSHNMGVITRLCKRSFLLDRGRLSAVGDTKDVITQYLNSGAETTGVKTWTPADPKWHSASVRPRELKVVSMEGETTGHVAITREFAIELHYEIRKSLPMFRVAFRFFTGDGTLAFMGADSSSPEFETKPTVRGSYVCRCIIPANLLNEGQYFVTVSGDVPFQEVIFYEESAITFTVEQTGGISSRFPEKWPGVVCPQLKWSTSVAHANDGMTERPPYTAEKFATF